MDADKANDLGEPTAGPAAEDATGVDDAAWAALTRQIEEVVDGAPVTVFFGVFRLLEGQDKYTWVKNRLTDKEYDSAARVLAQFHHSAFAFDPGDLAREQPPIMEFVPTLAGTFKECAVQSDS